MSKFTDENAAGIREIVKETGVEISALWCGWEVAPTWDFIDGYHTIGLVPLAYRARPRAKFKRRLRFRKKKSA